MTWFETEQIHQYVDELWDALEEWSLNRIQMKDSRAKLTRMHQTLKIEMAHHAQSPKNAVLQQLLTQMRQCRLCIDERLKR